MVIQFTLKDLKNYKAGREKAENFGDTFVLKNNQPDGVLLSFPKYKRLLVFIEYLESLEGRDITRVTDSFPKEGNRERCALKYVEIC